jgi:anti-repressor protein
MELIKISNENGKKTVNAIDLHSFLGSGQKFSDWIKNRVEQYSFIEGQDFTINLGKSTGGRPTQDYHLSLDMAKELSMVERNEKGKQARQYFIQCEEQLRTQAPQIANLSRMQILEMAIQSEKELIETKKQKAFIENKLQSAELTIVNLQPMAEYGEKVFSSENTYTSTNIATHLHFPSARAFNAILKEKGVIKKGTGSADWAVTAKFSNWGLTAYNQIPVIHSDGTSETRLQMRWTRKGFDWLCSQFADRLKVVR